MAAPKVGDRIEVTSLHRLHGEFGEIIAIGDNPKAEYNHYHIKFDRDIVGIIEKRHLWLGLIDFRVVISQPAAEAPTA
jgi:hypothetical protein